ncbi:hypothetical protein MHYP_G00096260 [Metynnis hypsauchen]
MYMQMEVYVSIFYKIAGVRLMMFHPFSRRSSHCLMNQTQTVQRIARRPSYTRRTNGSMRSVFQPSSSRAGGIVDLSPKNAELCAMLVNRVNCEASRCTLLSLFLSHSLPPSNIQLKCTLPHPSPHFGVLALSYSALTTWPLSVQEVTKYDAGLLP